MLKFAKFGLELVLSHLLSAAAIRLDLADWEGGPGEKSRTKRRWKSSEDGAMHHRGQKPTRREGGSAERAQPKRQTGPVPTIIGSVEKDGREEVPTKRNPRNR